MIVPLWLEQDKLWEGDIQALELQRPKEETCCHLW